MILVLGGGLAFTFLKAQGIPVGSSLVEEGMLDTARDLLAQAAAEGKKIVSHGGVALEEVMVPYITISKDADE